MFRNILQKLQMLDILVIFIKNFVLSNFVKLRHNRVLRNIFENILRCTVSTAGEVHETSLSIIGADLEPLHHVR